MVVSMMFAEPPVYKVMPPSFASDGGPRQALSPGNPLKKPGTCHGGEDNTVIRLQGHSERVSDREREREGHSPLQNIEFHASG